MSTLSRVNNGLLILIILVNGYIIIAPFFPTLVLWVQNHDQKNTAKQQTALYKTPASQNEPNTLHLPSILLNETIHEGTNTYAELDKGVWLWPNGSKPDQGGNTILIGHRFTYTTPRGVFYHLDKVQKGDTIGLTWSNKKYIYTVSDIQVVPPSQTDILNQSDTPKLTLYTCTSLLSPTKRLVITAPLKEIL